MALQILGGLQISLAVTWGIMRIVIQCHPEHDMFFFPAIYNRLFVKFKYLEQFKGSHMESQKDCVSKNSCCWAKSGWPRKMLGLMWKANVMRQILIWVDCTWSFFHSFLSLLWRSCSFRWQEYVTLAFFPLKLLTVAIYKPNNVYYPII